MNVNVHASLYYPEFPDRCDLAVASDEQRERLFAHYEAEHAVYLARSAARLDSLMSLRQDICRCPHDPPTWIYGKENS